LLRQRMHVNSSIIKFMTLGSYFHLDCPIVDSPATEALCMLRADAEETEETEETEEECEQYK
jgi:hypothetical protein